MGIYRGPGGTGDADTGAMVTQVAEDSAEAAASATAAASSATAASLSASAAAASEASVAADAAAASASASAALTSETNASTSETNAADSATAAAGSATSAASSATNAASSATAASSSATAAASSASAASTSATNAASSASAAATSATNAANSASAALTSATNSSNSATAASTSASAAAASADAALSALDSFDDRYLGQKSVEPTVDNDGNPLVTGALYFNTVDNTMKVYDGSQWLAAYASLSGALIAANNLSDLVNASSARTNLGLGTAATTDSTAYATAAQGTKADTAYGWGNHASAGYASDADVVKLTGDQTVAGTKTFSSNPTLSGGTANGVPYLNGSKVLTTGSALTFDGTNLYMGATVGAKLALYQSGGSNIYGFGVESGALTFLTSSSEQMRLTSTGLGIGTSSPAYKLDINKGSAGIVARFGGGGTSGILYSDATFCAIADSNGANGINIYGASNYLSFNTNSSEKLRLDSSGNLGLGVTPSAWTVGKVFEISNAFVFGQSQQAILGTNAYYNGGWKYKTSGTSARFEIASTGAMSWHTAPSGTAGSAISFTQAMTLDASGNLGIGTSSPAYNLDVRGTDPTAQVRATNASGSATLNLYGLGSNGSDLAVTQIKGVAESTGTAAALTFSTRNSAGTTAERMRLDSSGNVGIGTASPSYKLHVAGDIYATGNVTAYSDRTLKDNIKTVDNALGLVSQMRGVTYTRKDTGEAGVGVIAQEMQEVLPEVVMNKDGVMGVAYGNIVGVLIEAIKEQSAQIAELRAEIQTLKGE